MTTKKKLTEATLKRELQALGKTPRSIAAKLKKLGIYGHPRNCSTCPISNYLRSKHPKELISAGGTLACVGPVDVPLPSAIRTFIAKFDGGSFKYLRAY